MKKIKEKIKRKFLKAIYEIQAKFGVDFVGVSRTFPFGIKPTAEERTRLEEWFRQVGSAKAELYKEIFEDFKKAPSKYLGSKFKYETFFAQSHAFAEAKKKYPLVTSEPVGEGLRMEVSIPSFITNHERHFGETLETAKGTLKQIENNAAGLKQVGVEFDLDMGPLVSKLNELADLGYKNIIKTYDRLRGCDALIEDINALIGEYNYELNQALAAKRAEGVDMLDELGQLDAFPEAKEVKTFDEAETLGELKSLAAKKIDLSELARYLSKTAEKAERRIANRKLTFERRLAYGLMKHEPDEQRRVTIFLQKLDEKVARLEKHARYKPYDASNRNLYYGLLALRARLSHPSKSLEINTLKSRLSGGFLKVHGEREVITLPGFSWGEKPRKNVAFALKGKQLYICIAASIKPFLVGEKSQRNALQFVKTAGGSRKLTAKKPKTIAYILGDFNLEAEGLPLFLPLHFGRSHARRYLMNRQWGLFSETPKVFLNNARLKRIKRNPGDSWEYFLDVTLSADVKTYGFKDFQKAIFERSDAVIGVDRGEVNPIAYAVVKTSGEVIEKGVLGRQEYIEKLKAYDEKKRRQQSRGRLPAKGLRAKASRLQKTTLETAISQIISLAAKHKAAIALEDLGTRFRGQELSLIPKKTYKRVEELLANALNFAGLLRLGTKGPIKYWGAFLPVIAAGTSATCPKCAVRWRSRPPQKNKTRKTKGRKEEEKFYALAEILDYSRKQKFKNVDLEKKRITYNKSVLSLNLEWVIYSRWKPYGETKTLKDLGSAIREGREKETEYLLAGALKHRPVRDTFVCHACGFSGDSDEVAAVNIARRGAARIEQFLTK